MKVKILSLVIIIATVFVALALAPSSTTARPPIWKCKSVSHVATGWGVSYHQPTAAGLALHECRIRTPTYMLCSNPFCWVE
jgi:hypothetical protein